MTPAPTSALRSGTRAERPGAAARSAAAGHRSLLRLLLAGSLLAVAALTLSPAGTGWAWGAPVAELQWYAALSDDARNQLLGNLLLLMPSAITAALLWPRLTRQPTLLRSALAAGALIEVLQWSLPYGRVVSPVDAVLNAAGALAAAWAVGVARAPAGGPAAARAQQRKPVEQRR